MTFSTPPFTALWRKVVPPVLPLIVVIVILEFVIGHGWIKSYLVPAPSEVWQAFIESQSEIWHALLETTSSALMGLTLSFLVGTMVAVFFSLSPFLRRAIYPYAIFFQTVPIIAIAPLLVIWFGFGQSTVVASAFIVSVFPIIASTLLGLESTDPALVDLFRLYEASGWARLWRLRFPSALPQMFSGLRIASGLAVIGAIVGEFIAGGGIGSIVDVARTQQRIDKVFAAVLISALLGLGMVAFINFLSWFSLRHWHASARP